MTALVNTETGEIETAINYAIHPAANIFPLIDGNDFIALVEDIRRNGQREPVVLDNEGRLIDGRNRARACQALGIDVRETTYSGDDIAEFVVSHNLHRRHLTDTQRAMVAAKIANLPVGRPKTPSDEGISGTSRSAARSLLNVSEGSMHRAKVVEREGIPALVDLASEGKVPLASAVRVAQADPAEQERFVQEVRAGEEPTKASLKVAPSAPVRPPKAKALDHVPTSRDQRADLIAELAAQGYSSRQMPSKVGVTEESVRQIARDYDIDIPADRTVGKTVRINHTAAVESAVTELDNWASSLSVIDFAEVDVTGADEWVSSLTNSLTELRRFIKQIKEQTHV